MLCCVALASEACPDVAPKDIQALKELIKHIERNSNKKSIPAKKIAPIILRAAQEFGIDAFTISRLAALESRYVLLAYNKHTKDSGIMQINLKTASLYGAPKGCLKNMVCNVQLGTRILYDMKMRYEALEPDWICRYNVGTRARHVVNKNCLKYNSKLIAFN